VRKLKELSSVRWDEQSYMITLEESQYKGYVQSHPKDAEFLNKPIVNYMPMQIILAAALQLGNHLKLLLPLMLTPLKPLNEEGSSGNTLL